MAGYRCFIREHVRTPIIAVEGCMLSGLSLMKPWTLLGTAHDCCGLLMHNFAHYNQQQGWQQQQQQLHCIYQTQSTGVAGCSAYQLVKFGGGLWISLLLVDSVHIHRPPQILPTQLPPSTLVHHLFFFSWVFTITHGSDIIYIFIMVSNRCYLNSQHQLPMFD